MAVRVGINGFGRIGRLVFRVLAQHPSDYEVVAINDLADPKNLAMLLKYDSVHGIFEGTVQAGEKALVVNGKSIPVLTERDPANLPWKNLGCQVALESTGFFTSREKLQKHLHAGVYRSRAAAINMIPTKTGAAKAVGEVIPELNGKLTGFAVRVPVPDGSLTDLTVVLKKNVTKEEVNGAFKTASEGPLKGILEYNTDPIVSGDVIGNSHSCIFVPEQTLVIEGNLVKVIGWYDNEWGYSVRTAELIAKLGAL